ncbi:MAG: thiopurine S-methyltransferase [Proteobacteria bacterium]|nr:thiopurine S-methyltransferase [Pseudomonadota bacterium]
MQADFWLERWRQRQIGWHQPDFHPALEKYWPTLGIDPSARVFVPLCGRSLDMIWLARRGHPVLGVELSPIAASEFFGHEALSASPSVAGRFIRHAAGPYEILQGDFFDLTPAMAGAIGAWYDRAALIALPPDLRVRYADRIAGMLAPGTCGLLITAEYAQEKMAGPPFAVMADEVHALFDAGFEVELLERQDVTAGNPRFVERGLDRLHEAVFRLVRR